MDRLTEVWIEFIRTHPKYKDTLDNARRIVEELPREAILDKEVTISELDLAYKKAFQSCQ